MGGFKTEEEEQESKSRGQAMIQRVIDHPGMLQDKIIKLPEGEMLPNFYLSEDDNIILCGRIDWLSYRPQDDSIHILDFKTGKNEEKEDSLQLPIYQLLLNKLQKRKVTGASYWYLDSDDNPKEVALPTVEESFDKVYVVAKQVSDARSQAKRDGIENIFTCPRGEQGCFSCNPFEKIIKGEAEFVGKGEWGNEMYMV
jgi:hypothetical protein